ncbi:MAG TPA: beta-galactosidase [Capsulimonadaceae bacterium]|jgi:beta-galactosidase
MKYFGCAYYPEYWGSERIRVDAALMRDAGINTVRIGEFAWTRMEPAEGVFTLDWLHECVTTMAGFGIDVILCTPTATPPAWLTSQYPDTLAVRMDGKRCVHGHRRHYCMSSDTYRRHCARIATALATEFGHYDNVIGWQIDNELGPENTWCHCENCQSRFRVWVQHRYSTLDELNRAWGSGFWSMDYTEWSQIRLQDIDDCYASRSLDSKRFWSELTVDFCSHQATILRHTDPGAIVTTNCMGPIYWPIDYYKLYADLDVACDDLYFDATTMAGNTCALDVFRNLKPKSAFWLTETGVGALDHNKPPHPDQFRAWMWSSFARGCEAYMIFRWRTCPSGQEQELQGMLEHSGQPRHRYNTVKRAFNEAISLAPKLADLPLPTAKVAIVSDYESLWSYISSRVNKSINYERHVLQLHAWFYESGIQVDVISKDADFAGYNLIVLPSMVTITPDFTAKVTAYVTAGGAAFATGQLGMRDDNCNYRITPDPIQSLFGATIEGGMYLRDNADPEGGLGRSTSEAKHIALPVTADGLPSHASAMMAEVWAGDITLNGAGVADMSFATDQYAGQPAVVSNRVGSGHTCYVATTGANNALLDTCLLGILQKAGISPGPRTMRNVDVVHRGNVTFVINHRTEPVDVPVGAVGASIIGAIEDGVAHLEQFGVAIFEGMQTA